jgi:hypothetical protein
MVHLYDNENSVLCFAVGIWEGRWGWKREGAWLFSCTLGVFRHCFVCAVRIEIQWLLGADGLVFCECVMRMRGFV